MLKRIITAIIALIIFIPILILGNWPFTILVYLMATIGLFELIQMRNIHHKVPIIFSFLGLWTILLPSSNDKIIDISYTKPQIFILIMVILLLYIVLSQNNFTIDEASYLLFSILYIGLSFYLLLSLRSLGLEYILLVLFIIWATDTGAYFIGNAMGKHKLWPAISPNKTIEGALGGIICAIIVSLIYGFFVNLAYSIPILLLLTVFISVAGQMGDLIASSFKRHFSVKDSGSLMPGHGGIIDRLDSLLFVLICLYVIQII